MFNNETDRLRSLVTSGFSFCGFNYPIGVGVDKISESLFSGVRDGKINDSAGGNGMVLGVQRQGD
jgi:hypothetical protein